MAEPQHFDIVVLGGGSGLTVAYHARRDDRSVALVEARPDALGGTCVNRGCIPTKGLVQAAEVLKTVRTAGEFGIEVDQDSVRVDFGAIMSTIRERRAASAQSVREWVDGDMTPLYGRARFVGDKLLEMDDGRRLTGERIFVATGARPRLPELDGLAEIEPWTNEEALEATTQPDSLIVLGGGYIGVELGHFFATLGTRVTVIDRSHCLLREDDDVREVFTREFAKKVELVRRHDAVRAVREGGQKGLVVRDQDSGAERTVLADAVLVATGRAPNTDGLGLDATGVETDEGGWIRVDDRLRTTHRDVYAYGDIIGQAMFKHTSSTEGELAYRNSQGGDETVSYRTNPHAIFSDPQIGAVGLTERECEEQGLRYRVAKKGYDSVAKGRIVGSPPGFAKLIVEEETDRILGFHVVGPQAADLIHEVVVAMNAGDGTAALVRRTIHVHPTLSELVRAAFDALG